MHALRSLLLVSSLFSVFPLVSHADSAPATILIGGRIVPFQVKPFIGPAGQIMAPVDAVQLLGAKFTPKSDGTVEVTAANGRNFRVPYTLVQGRYCVPFQNVAQSLGGTAEWQPSTATLTVRAKLEMVRQDYNELTVVTSYPVYYSVKRINNPERLYVDLFGLDLATTPANIPNTGGSVTHIRSGQINYETVRITIDLKQGMPFRVLSGIQTNQIKVALNDSGEPAAPISAAPPPFVAHNLPTPQLLNNSSGVTITRVDYKVVSPALTQVTVTTTGPAKYRTETLNNPNRLAFDLAGATLDRGVKASQMVDNPILKAIRVGKLLTEQTAFGRVVLDLSKMVGFSVDSRSSGSGMSYLINVMTSGASSPPLVVPDPVSNEIPVAPVTASLAGKIFVVDPGHGGRDTGARDEFRTGQVYEKDITLAIGRRVRQILMQEGAMALMTRNDDSLPSVMARPAFANSHNADYFVSIHCDSSGGQNTHAGTTVYYHAQNGLCRLMASNIGRRISQTSGISYNGVKSDTIRFGTGFGVLRGSNMPAVLIETGYMNNDGDLSKLRDDVTQQNIAEGIVAGLRDFIAAQVAGARSANGGRNVPRRAY